MKAFKLNGVVLFAFSVACMSGCESLTCDTNHPYHEAKVGVAIQVPDDLDESKKTGTYPLPEAPESSIEGLTNRDSKGRCLADPLE